MKLNSKTVLLTLLTVGGLFALVLVMVLAEKTLTLWEQLKAAPLWLSALYLTIIMLVAAVPIWLYLKLTKPTTSKKPTKVQVIDESSLVEAIEKEQTRGVNTEGADAEMVELQRRRQSGRFHISLFGHASSGKSSLINALIPETEIATDVVKGTTIEAHHHSHGQLVITDLPGFDAIGQEELAQLALEESQRAHVVVFLLDTDISRTEMQLFEQLNQWHKPMVIALNKMDLYTDQQVQQLIEAIRRKTDQQYPVVMINTGGFKRIIIEHPDGARETQNQPIPIDIKPLLSAIEQVISDHPDALHRFRDAGILMLAERKLNHASQSFNAAAAEDTIERHTKRAIIGALASVAPGSDLVIQGTIGTQLVREICGLYDVPVNQLQVDSVLKSTGGKLRTSTSLVLAVAGNALKAFPGVGTAAGGIMHAVAYGLIFNSLGQAVLTTVQAHGTLDTEKTQQSFEEHLLGSSKELAKDLAKMALKISRSKSA